MTIGAATMHGVDCKGIDIYLLLLELECCVDGFARMGVSTGWVNVSVNGIKVKTPMVKKGVYGIVEIQNGRSRQQLGLCWEAMISNSSSVVARRLNEQ